MLDLTTRADLQRLIDEGLPESLTLDYKASAALSRNNEGRSELVKDVTAFANSAGGQIVYGIIERGGAPQAIEAGVDSTSTSPEWIGQVLDTNSSPRVYGVEVIKIQLALELPNMVAYVISVPAATTFAPHQNAIDKKYYRRFDLRSVPMNDYEIRDLLRRAQIPNIVVRFSFGDGGPSHQIRRATEHFEIIIDVENISSEPALYSLIEILVDNRILVIDKADCKMVSSKLIGKYTLTTLQKKLMVPNDFPLIKGSTLTIGPPFLTIAVPEKYFGMDETFLIGYAAVTSGFHTIRCAAVSQQGSILTICEAFDV